MPAGQSAHATSGGYGAAQTSPARSGGTAAEGAYKISGQVVDGSGKGVEYATVSILRQQDSALVGGVLAGADGKFVVDKIPAGAFKVRITFLGYGTALQENVTLSADVSEARLGKILLSEQSKKLAEVEVTAERPVFQLGIDRKIFDVSRSNLNPGGTASDVLGNVPTVTVDVDGNVSMRNNENVTIYIDGRPSGITGANRAAILRQIPASAIDRIELITSPSARYDAEGVSGIINIILKKNRLEGFNGSVQGSVGTRDKYNGSANIAYRNSHVNAYLNYTYRFNRRYGYGTSDRYSFLTDSLTYLSDSLQKALTLRTQTASTQRNYESGHLIKVGSDFFLGRDNTIGASGTYSPNLNSEYELANYAYHNGAGTETRPSSARYSQTAGKATNYEATLTHIKKFDSKGHELSSQANYADFSSSSLGQYQQFGSIAADASQAFLNQPLQQNNTTNSTRTLTLQTDYVHPFANGIKFELGGKSSTRRILTDYQYLATDSEGVLQEVPSVRNTFEYREQIFAAYGIFGCQLERFGYQAGIRAEQSTISSKLLTTAESFPQDYLNFFPSINASYKLSQAHELQASYSRRIIGPGAKHSTLSEILQTRSPSALAIQPLSLNSLTRMRLPGNTRAATYH